MPGARTEVVPVGVTGINITEIEHQSENTEVGIPIELIETRALLRSAKFAKYATNRKRL